jgi:hypothetical protein
MYALILRLKYLWNIFNMMDLDNKRYCGNNNKLLYSDMYKYMCGDFKFSRRRV